MALAKQSFGNAMSEKKLSHEIAATCYSLYKQATDGDADDFEENELQTTPERYQVWKQQDGKNEMQCLKEYIILMGQVDPHFNETVKNVASGAIREINFETVGDRGPMTKSVPVPSKPDDTEYVA